LKSKTLILWIALSLAVHAAILNLSHRPRQYAQTESGPIEICMVRLLPVTTEKTETEPSPETTKMSPIPPTPIANHLDTETNIRQSKPQRSQPTLENARTERRYRPEETAKQLPVNVTTKDLPVQPPPTAIEPTPTTAPTNKYPEKTCVNRTSTAQNAPNENSSFVKNGATVPLPSHVNPLTTQTKPPRYRRNPPPPYPLLARKRHWQGEVWLRVFVGEEGNVIDAWVENSSGYPILDKSALDTVRDWMFHPAKNGIDTVKGEVRFPIRFKLRGS
jgi:periplasmic protein TonB